MTNEERWQLYDSGEFHRAIAIELLDWAGYWTTTGLDEITDPLQKAQSKQAITIIITDLSYANKVVASLAISDSRLVETELSNVNEALIKAIVVSIMANKLEWLTGIDRVDEEIN